MLVRGMVWGKRLTESKLLLEKEPGFSIFERKSIDGMDLT
jgi:hypothetical protein